MHKISIIVLIAIGLVSYGCLSQKTNFFKNANFHQNANWLFVRTNTESNTCQIITDKEVLLNFHNDLVIKETVECGGTTPDNCLALYKNGSRISSVCYCSWELLSFKFGQLNSKFIPAKFRMIEANSIARYNSILDSLKNVQNIYLLNPEDTIIKLPVHLKFDIKLADRNQDIFKQEKPIEEKFKQIFKEGNYSVRANWYLSETGKPRMLGYHILVDCDSAFLNHFGSSKLIESELFKSMTEPKYEKKVFKIKYYDWNN